MSKKIDELMARLERTERLEAQAQGRVYEDARRKALERLEPGDPHLYEVRRHRRLYELNTIWVPLIKAAIPIGFGLWLWFAMSAH